MPSILDLPVSSAADIPPSWIETVREALHREGLAFRAGASHTIEVQSQGDGKFRALTLPNNGHSFATADTRDLILAQLVTTSAQATKDNEYSHDLRS